MLSNTVLGLYAITSPLLAMTLSMLLAAPIELESKVFRSWLTFIWQCLFHCLLLTYFVIDDKHLKNRTFLMARFCALHDLLPIVLILVSRVHTGFFNIWSGQSPFSDYLVAVTPWTLGLFGLSHTEGLVKQYRDPEADDNVRWRFPMRRAALAILFLRTLVWHLLNDHSELFVPSYLTITFGAIFTFIIPSSYISLEGIIGCAHQTSLPWGSIASPKVDPHCVRINTELEIGFAFGFYPIAIYLAGNLIRLSLEIVVELLRKWHQAYKEKALASQRTTIRLHFQRFRDEAEPDDNIQEFEELDDVDISADEIIREPGWDDAFFNVPTYG